MMTPFPGPLESQDFDQRKHSLGDDVLAEGGERSPMQQQFGLDDGTRLSHVAIIDESADSLDTSAYASSSRTYSSLVLIDDDENTPVPHASNHQVSIFPPCVSQVKAEKDSETRTSGQPAHSLTLISNEEFNHSGQPEEGEPTYVIVSPQSTGTSGGVLSEETWTHSGQATSSSGGLVTDTSVQYQRQPQQQQTSSLSTFTQQPQPHSTQTSLPGIKEISGFYQSVPMPESSMLDRSHYAPGPQGTHHTPAQYIGLYNATHYAAPGMESLPMSHPYPIAMGFHEIPLVRRRRERRHQVPHGISSRYDPSRPQQSGIKAESSGVNELMSSPNMTVRSESFKQEHGVEGSDGLQPLHRNEVQDRDPDPKACNNCQTTTTPSWRRCPKGRILLCNACGLYQKLHGKSRPHYLAKDGTIKVQRIVPEHAPCVQCHTRTSPTWKKGPKGEAICHACSTTMKLGRSQGKSKAPRIEYPKFVDMMSVGSENMYSGEPSSGDYSEAISARGFHAHGLDIGAGEFASTSSSYGDVEGVQRRSRSSSTRYSTRTTQRGGYLIDHPSRSGVNQYQGSHPVVYGFGQVGPTYGLAQYGGYDASGYSLASVHAYPSSPGGWQPDVSVYGSGAYVHGAGPFTLESSSTQPGQSFQRREAAGLLRMDSSSALPASNQTSHEGQQLLVPYNRPTQANYITWGQAQQNRMSHPSLHSAAWSADSGGGEGSGGQILGTLSDVSLSQDLQQQQQQHRMLLINQRSGSANSRQELLSQGLLNFTASTSNETLRQDRHQTHQDAHHDSLLQHQAATRHIQQQQQAIQHVYRSVYGQQQQHHQSTHTYSSYPVTLPTRSHSPTQDQKNQDYEVALQSYVQAGGTDDAGMSSHSAVAGGGSTIDTPVEQVTEARAGEMPAVAVSDPSQQKDSSSDQERPISDLHTSDGGEITKSASNLEAMAAETLANTFFDRQSTATALSPVLESGPSSRMAPHHSVPTSEIATAAATIACTPVVMTEVNKQMKNIGSAITDVGYKVSSSTSSAHKAHHYQQQHGSTAPLTSASGSGRNAETSSLSAIPIPEESYSGEASDGHRPRRSERHRPAGTLAASKSVKKHEGLMSQYLNRRH
ncbi:Erythroid transcription factor [Linnemannia gamsii]|uniref:Erythroid transcription factor n=1 Tax=Linnemannia gamsii TaxID=64522 RepID=A0ABQ7KB11_9FUNG|nr:Erythroid transcription factor [Linnemannia gamsii]